jgi:hypothetical protein
MCASRGCQTHRQARDPACRFHIGYVATWLWHHGPCPADLDEQAQQEAGEPPGSGGDAAANGPANGERGATAAAAAEDPSAFLRRDGEAALDYAARVFRRVFQEDIVRLLGVKVGGCLASSARALHSS